MPDFFAWSWPQIAAVALAITILTVNTIFHGHKLVVSRNLTLSFNAPYSASWVGLWGAITYAGGFF